MLTIKPIGGSQTEVQYYTALGNAEEHDYYSEHGKAQGVYYGAGADELGFSGAVDNVVFRNLLEGLSPDGKERLVRQRAKGQIHRRSGFDLTFNLCKSFSLAWSQADRETREELDARARKALYRTLDLVEELCGQTRRGIDGVRVERGKLAFAVFSHDTARGVPGEMPDVNRHFHAVLANVAIRSDGSTGALDARPLFQKRMKMALGAMFRCELSKELDEMGLRTVRPQRDGKTVSWFELSCVPKPLIEAASKRSQTIQQWMQGHGVTGAKAAERAALATRERKQSWSQEELFREWRKLSTGFGFSVDAIRSELATGPNKRTSVECRKANVVQTALQSLISSTTRFTEIEILERVAVEAQCQGLGIDEIQSAVQSTLQNSNEIVRLKNDKSGVKTFTTKTMLAIEKRMMRTSEFLNAKTTHLVPAETATEVLSRFATLRGEQTEAIRHMVSGPDIACVNGVAGSGKTFMMQVAREIWEHSGYSVLGTALAAKAAKGLEDGSGIRSVHLHKLLRDLDRGEIQLGKSTIVAIDESGMVGTMQMERLLSAIHRAGAKAVLLGDWKQLQSIDAGAAFRGIAEKVGYQSLDQIIRQRERWARGVVRDLRDGKAHDALQQLYERGRLFIGTDRIDAMSEVVTDWKAKVSDPTSLKETVVFAGTNREVKQLNRLIQAERRERGDLGEAEIAIGDYEFSLGDRVMVTRNNPVLCLRNGATGELVGIEDCSVSIRLDDGLTIDVDTTEFDKLSLVYAMSVHKGQGITCENALILTGDSMTDREISYVEGSRARGFTKFYSDELSSGVSIPELAERMNVSRQAENALEYELSLTGQ
ncbi:MAG: relaxase domain-containing protein [Planctomycetales bacterium]|nr:relaxase domain-containing protein [Planctomycetales bacterium]